MSKMVRVVDNVVIEIIPEEATFPGVATWYGDEFAAQCMEAPDEVQQNYIYNPDTKTFSEPAAPTTTAQIPSSEERIAALEAAVLALMG